jgi:hypothetical protein
MTPTFPLTKYNQRTQLWEEEKIFQTFQKTKYGVGSLDVKVLDPDGRALGVNSSLADRYNWQAHISNVCVELPRFLQPRGGKMNEKAKWLVAMKTGQRRTFSFPLVHINETCNSTCLHRFAGSWARPVFSLINLFRCNETREEKKKNVWKKRGSNYLSPRHRACRLANEQMTCFLSNPNNQCGSFCQQQWQRILIALLRPPWPWKEKVIYWKLSLSFRVP